MYEIFYKLAKDPFRLIPDHHFCYRHRSYVRADAYVQYALSRGEGIVLITGEPGTGKTTLSTDLLARLGTDQVTAARLVTSQLEANDFLRAVALGFGLQIQSRDKLDVLHALEGFLAEEQQRSRRALLIVDEAHELLDGAFTELRLLTNLVNSEGQPLLQVILLGQKDILETLHAPRMEQLRQRVVAGRHLQPLDADETQAYIEHRLTQAGWDGNPELDSDIYSIIHKESGGVPRLINLLCSRLMLYGALEERQKLTSSDIELVTEGLRREQLLPRQIETAVDTTDPVGTKPGEVVAEPPQSTRRQQRHFTAFSEAARKTARTSSLRRTWVPAAGAIAAGFVSWVILSNLSFMRPDPVGEGAAVQTLPRPPDERMAATAEQYQESADTNAISLSAEASSGSVPTLSDEGVGATENVAGIGDSRSAPASIASVESEESDPLGSPRSPTDSAVMDTEQNIVRRNELAAFEEKWQQLEEETNQSVDTESAAAALHQLSSDPAETASEQAVDPEEVTTTPSVAADTLPANFEDDIELEPAPPAVKETLAMTEVQPVLDGTESPRAPTKLSEDSGGVKENGQQAPADSSPALVKKPASEPTGDRASSATTSEAPKVLARTKSASPTSAPREVTDDASAKIALPPERDLADAQLDETLFRASRLAIVPFQTGTGCAWPIETVMVETILDLVRANDSLELAYSFYDGNAMATQTGPSPDVWGNDDGSGPPDPAAAYNVGATLGVGLVVTAQIECAQSSGIYEAWRPFDIYLYDVERKEIHHHRNSLKNLTNGTRKVFSDFLAARGLALQRE